MPLFAVADPGGGSEPWNPPFCWKRFCFYFVQTIAENLTPLFKISFLSGTGFVYIDYSDRHTIYTMVK